MKVALYHYRNKILARRYNTEKVNKAANEARRNDATLMCISPLMSVTDLIGIYQLNRIKAIVRNYAGRIPSSSIEPLIKVAEEHSLYIIVGGILERAGPKLFMSSLLITPDGRIKGKTRKITVSKEESALGLSPGRIQTINFIIHKYNLGVLIDTDMLAPEYARLQKATGANLFVAFFKRRLKKGNAQMIIRSLAMARALETSSTILLCGGIVEHHGEILYAVPSMIVTPNGIRDEVSYDEKVLYCNLSELDNNYDVLNLSSISYSVLSDTYRELSKIFKYK